MPVLSFCLALDYILYATVEIFLCTWPHTWCYALRSSLARDHTPDSTRWDLLLHLTTHLMQRFGISLAVDEFFETFFFPAAMKKSRFATPKPARSKSRPTVTANSQHVWSPPAKISALCCGFAVAPTASGDCESASPRGVWKTTLPSFRVGKMNIQQKFLTLSDLNVIKQLYPEVLGKHR